MATDSVGNKGRDLSIQAVHYLRKGFDYTNTGTEVSMGYIPSGSLILKPMSGVHVTTAFNAGTNNLLDIGGGTGNDDPDEWGTDLSLTTTTFVPLDEAIGTYLLTADTEITFTPELTGATATSGAAEVVICYIPDNDG